MDVGEIWKGIDAENLFYFPPLVEVGREMQVGGEKEVDRKKGMDVGEIWKVIGAENLFYFPPLVREWNYQ
jgi:hypothetical protein